MRSSFVRTAVLLFVSSWSSSSLSQLFARNRAWAGSTCACLQSIGATNEFVLKRHQEVLRAMLGAPVERQGQTDLAIGGLKFSGNAQRRHRRCLMFHGSLLLHLDLGLVEEALPMPSRQPEYRLNRSHSDFLMNLKVPANALKPALADAWNAAEPLTALPRDQLNVLVREKYGRGEWNLKF